MASWVRVETPSLLKIEPTCQLTVRGPMKSASAMSPSGLAGCEQAEHLLLPPCQFWRHDRWCEFCSIRVPAHGRRNGLNLSKRQCTALGPRCSELRVAQCLAEPGQSTLGRCPV